MLLPELVTPCLVVDLDALEANITAMAGLAARLGVDLRPHAKTHKCLPIAARQLAGGAVGLTVATVAEAEVFAEVCTDLFIAYPLWVDAARGRRLRELSERVRLGVGVDSVAAVEMLAAHRLPGVDVLVEVDSGQHRTGVGPDGAAEVGLAAARAGLSVRGVFTFPGHAYAPGAAAPAGSEEAVALRAAEAALRRVGLDTSVRSGGSTPSAAHTRGGVVTEMRPGVYVFCDAQQVELGVATTDQVALFAVGTVVSRGSDRVVLDCGSKVLGADRAGWAAGFGLVPDAPGPVVALSEHHATVPWPREPPALGTLVPVIPNHVCAAVNLADELLVLRAGALVDRWPVAARGANT